MHLGPSAFLVHGGEKCTWAQVHFSPSSFASTYEEDRWIAGGGGHSLMVTRVPSSSSSFGGKMHLGPSAFLVHGGAKCTWAQVHFWFTGGKMHLGPSAFFPLLLRLHL